MGVLFWYMFRQYTKVFFMCVSALLTVYLVVDFFEKLRKFLKYDADLSSMLLYFFYRIPDICFQITPLAALMGTLLTLGFLNKSAEITAMRSCGMSFYQIASPFFAVGIIVSAILFSFTAVFVPLANIQADYVRTVLIEKKPAALSVSPDRVWLRLGQDGLLKIGAVKDEGQRLSTISLYRVDEQFQLHEIIESPEARYTNEGWELREATRRIVQAGGEVTADRYAQLALGLPLTPEDFRTWLALDSKNMTLKQLGAYVQRLKRDGHSSSRFATDYWGRVAFSAMTLVMTVMGLAISLLKTGARDHAVAKGIGQALGIGFLFWVTHSFGMVLGKNGALMPIAAGWFACLMFLVIGLNLFLRTR
ncbi:MAG: LPS export ABC transporter permease LptG [Nitrospirales bacterium]|nr:MAG: LPS export ABC transporter permease LptG [Nitrospirales bacterium]